MKWPRGRFNGQRIVGVHVAVSVDVTRWRCFIYGRHTIAIGLGPVIVWPRLEYREDYR